MFFHFWDDIKSWSGWRFDRSLMSEVHGTYCYWLFLQLSLNALKLKWIQTEPGVSCCTIVLCRFDAVQYECVFSYHLSWENHPSCLIYIMSGHQPWVLSQLMLVFVSIAAGILEKLGKPNIKLQMVGALEICLNLKIKEQKNPWWWQQTNLWTVSGHLSLANNGWKPDKKHTQVFSHNWWVRRDKREKSTAHWYR